MYNLHRMLPEGRVFWEGKIDDRYHGMLVSGMTTASLHMISLDTASLSLSCHLKLTIESL